MHVILYLAYFFDWIYGTLTNLPWQYRLIAALGWIYLTLQQLQIMNYYRYKQRYTLIFLCSLVWMGNAMLFGYSFYHTYHTALVTCFGVIAQISFCMSFLPQILKSRQKQSISAISLTYISFNVFLSCLDIICAWQLNWGLPNKLGSISLLCLALILILQKNNYKNKQCISSERHPESGIAN
jgi:uncharacterized protein with PQ loop repeat